MLGLTATKDPLDWAEDESVTAARRAVAVAKEQVILAETEEQRLWVQDHCQGTNPSPDSEFWAARQHANDARKMLTHAVAVRDQTEAAAKASVRVAWVEGYRDRTSKIFALENELIEALIELEQWRDGAEGQGFTGLPWVAPGQMSIADLRQNQAARKRLVEQYP